MKSKLIFCSLQMVSMVLSPTPKRIPNRFTIGINMWCCASISDNTVSLFMIDMMYNNLYFRKKDLSSKLTEKSVALIFFIKMEDGINGT